ncbi:murein biosynthesis integral membrane protein MurJ [Streptomonospora sp. S1-112]|uniref:Murein biosynthesis integral membrane protein MurJ n=1 Tax=Streptomonospora mangrovi TaxID=2883123 RepID=A0A9X3NP12_9ACTN|nr:murein biosynthesis integral membrane protein MurJ [Streptomonospora mangrovi]MDA0565299.1 murein biosynthesis integral membrane protein MurJ [Streptomonospora mangrovi]
MAPPVSNDQTGPPAPRPRRRLPMPEEVLDAVERTEPGTQPEPGLVVVHDPADYGDLGTADRPGEEGNEIGGAAHAAPDNLLRSSAVMAVGTVVSRATGFVRTIVLAAALGTQLLGDAYQTANMVPFAVYDLLIGGLLASVFVPFLVKRKKQDADGGTATEQRLFTVMLLVLAVITVVAIAAAELLIRLYAGEFTSGQHDAATLLARFLLGQIFFIGASGIASAMLNSRNRFGAPMWAPVLNNLVIIAVGAMFLVVAGPGSTPETITDGQLTLLGLGTTCGQVVQALVLLWALFAAGFRWRPRLDLRGSGLGEAVRTAAWMMLYIGVAQAGLLVTTNVATRAGVRVVESGEAAAGAGITAYQYASMLFQLPYAIIAVSVITALLPRMSAHVADGRRDLVRADFSRGFRLSAVLIVPISVAMVVFAIPFCVLIYANGSTTTEDAQGIGRILMVFSVMLIPFTLFQLLMRVYYALGDTKTPSLIALPAEAAHAALAITLLFAAPPRLVVVLLPVAYGLYYVVGSVLAWRGLRARMNGLDGRRVLRTLLLLHVATVPSAVFGVAMILMFGLLPGTVLPSLLAMAAGGVVGALLFVLVAKRLGVTEVTTFLDMVRDRLLRR